MLVKMRVFDENQKELVFFQTDIDPEKLVEVAKEKEAFAKEKGKSFTQGAVPFFGEQFINAVKKSDESEIKRSAIEAAMAAWLSDSIFGGVSKQDFILSDLEFSLHPTGMVVYKRRFASHLQ